MQPTDPKTVVERQLAAYNAHDLPAFLATYAADAEQYLADGTLLARGGLQISERMRPRFGDPALRAELLNRVLVGATVIDHEQVTRTGPDGVEAVPMVCMYAVSNGRIVRATFAIGEPRALAPQ